MRVRRARDLVKRRALNEHSRYEHHVGPVEIRRVERPHVEIAQPHLPCARQQRRDREQPERRKHRLPPGELE